MKVLIVASYNYGKYSPFVSEQAGLNIQIDYFPVKGKGVFGYLKNRKGLLFKIEEYHPDIIHAHYGLSGLLANLQREVPVVTTFHGSDIHSGGIWLLLSKMHVPFCF
jgi:teichuronic acid biosynthesis glycosyltransferase TuaC